MMRISPLPSTMTAATSQSCHQANLVRTRYLLLP